MGEYQSRESSRSGSLDSPAAPVRQSTYAGPAAAPLPSTEPLFAHGERGRPPAAAPPPSPAATPAAAWTPVSREAQILAILKTGEPWPVKRDQLGAELALLDQAESRQLRDRLVRQDPGDPIATALAPGIRITPAHHAELVAFLEAARQRAVVGKPVPPVRRVAVREPSIDELDARMRQLLVNNPPDLEAQLLAMFATLDGTSRRTLARRFETYRQGSGDEIAARFKRLDRSTQVTIVRALELVGQTPPKLPPAPYKATPFSMRLELARYLGLNSNGVWRSLIDHLIPARWVTASDRIELADRGLFLRTLEPALRDAVLPTATTHAEPGNVDASRLDLDLGKLEALLYPVQLD